MRTRSSSAAQVRGLLFWMLQSTMLAGGACCNAETSSSVAVVANYVTTADSNKVQILGCSSWQ